MPGSVVVSFPSPQIRFRAHHPSRMHHHVVEPDNVESVMSAPLPTRRRGFNASNATRWGQDEDGSLTPFASCWGEVGETCVFHLVRSPLMTDSLETRHQLPAHRAGRMRPSTRKLNLQPSNVRYQHQKQKHVSRLPVLFHGAPSGVEPDLDRIRALDISLVRDFRSGRA